MQNERKFLDAMESDIMNADIPDSEKNKLMKNFLTLKQQKINLMITGATGCGKSSTINALFNTEVAKVGTSPDPETMEITKYEMDNLVLWDSPGLGDGKEADNRHARNIIKKLNERDGNGNLLIDLVLVILDGSTRDLGTSYELINSVIVPNLGEDKSNRILVAINQADVAASFQKAVTDVLVEHAMKAIDEYKVDKFAIAGGVASNGALRKAMREACARKGVKFYHPSPILCTDNAAMIGAAAYYDYIAGKRSGFDLNAVANLRLGE